MKENLIIFNTRVVTPIGFSARRGTEMSELLIQDNATVEVTDGIITYVGPIEERTRWLLPALLALQRPWQMFIAGFCRFAYTFCIWR